MDCARTGLHRPAPTLSVRGLRLKELPALVRVYKSAPIANRQLALTDLVFTTVIPVALPKSHHP